jgi:DNA-binding NtrC family response regulator
MTNTKRLLVFHSDPSVRMLLSSMLQTMNVRVDEAATDRTTVRMLEQSPFDLLLACVDPQCPDALELLAYVRRKHPSVPVVLLFTALQNDRVREAIQWGAAAVLRFPSPATQLRAAVAQSLGWTHEEPAQCVGASSLAGGMPPTASFEVRVGREHDSPHRITRARSATGSGGRATPPPAPLPVGHCPAFRQVVELAASLAAAAAPVLIVGERGSGKTLLARVLHERGPRATDGPLIVVDCSAFREAELEAELFGTPPTVGIPGRPGKIEAAHGGTLLIERVHLMPASIQHRLAQLLQDGCGLMTTPDGTPARLDVRFVFTGRDESTGPAASDPESIHPELLDRISLITLRIPPLRRRGEDVVRLAEHFRDRVARTRGREVATFAPDALDALRRHDWTGNVRELETIVTRAVGACHGPRIEARHLDFSDGHGLDAASRLAPPPRRTARPTAPILPLKEALEEPERQYILQALEQLNWNRQETARVLDINRTTLYKKMKKYGLLFDEPVWAN